MNERRDIKAVDDCLARLPDDRTVLLAAIANPAGFLAVHGCSAHEYIRQAREVRAMLIELKGRMMFVRPGDEA